MPVNRTKLIKKYVDAQTKDKAHEIVRVPLRQGLALDVVSIPVMELRFNPQLGRIILAGIGSKKDGQQDSEKQQKEIQKTLLEQKEAKELRKHLDADGQLHPGIITTDGVVINGNRRLAVLRQLWDDSGKTDQRFEFMRVGVLPADMSAADLYLLEVKLQMTPEVRVKYGPFTTLAQAKFGLDRHKLEKPRLAAAMDLEPEELDYQLELLQIVDEYLSFIKRPGKYDLLEAGGRETETQGKYEHFITLKALKERHGSQPYWEAFQRHLFQMIRAGETYATLRKVKKWKLEHFSRFATEAGGTTPTKPGTATASKVDPAIAGLAAGLTAINESVAPEAAAVATVMPTPSGPAKPEKGGIGDPETDPELEKTISALNAVNDILDTQKFANRPIDLLKQAVTKLEAFNKLPADMVSNANGGVSGLVAIIEGLVSNARKRISKKKGK